jgi:hypothetical protein
MERDMGNKQTPKDREGTRGRKKRKEKEKVRRKGRQGPATASTGRGAGVWKCVECRGSMVLTRTVSQSPLVGGCSFSLRR